MKKIEKLTEYKCRSCHKTCKTIDEASNCWDKHHKIWSSMHPIDKTKLVIVFDRYNRVSSITEYPKGVIITSKGEYRTLQYLIEFEDLSRLWHDWENVIEVSEQLTPTEFDYKYWENNRLKTN